MKKILAISDIHGCYEQFKQLLELSNYHPSTHQLIIIGDLIDRGPDSFKMLQYAKKLKEEDGAIILRGNHESMFLEYIKNNDNFILMHGGIETVCSFYKNDFELKYEEYPNVEEFNKKYKNHILEHYQDIIDFVDSLPFYHETDDFLFVHAGIIPSYGEDWKNMELEDMLWLPYEHFVHETLNIGKTVVFGHTPTINIHKDPYVWFGKDKICIDGGFVFGHSLHALEIEYDEEYDAYSYNVYSLNRIDGKKEN